MSASSVKLPFDTSTGLSWQTYRSLRQWLETINPLWRIALIALVMVWGMVILLLVMQYVRGEVD
jgi:hypothetical protein